MRDRRQSTQSNSKSKPGGQRAGLGSHRKRGGPVGGGWTSRVRGRTRRENRETVRFGQVVVLSSRYGVLRTVVEEGGLGSGHRYPPRPRQAVVAAITVTTESGTTHKAQTCTFGKYLQNQYTLSNNTIEISSAVLDIPSGL